jgi:hypothetical protein
MSGSEGARVGNHPGYPSVRQAWRAVTGTMSYLPASERGNAARVELGTRPAIERAGAGNSRPTAHARGAEPSAGPTFTARLGNRAAPTGAVNQGAKANWEVTWGCKSPGGLDDSNS